MLGERKYVLNGDNTSSHSVRNIFVLFMCFLFIFIYVSLFCSGGKTRVTLKNVWPKKRKFGPGFFFPVC